MISTSAMWGTLCRTKSPSASTVAAISLSTEFLAPLTRTVPDNGPDGRTTNDPWRQYAPGLAHPRHDRPRATEATLANVLEPRDGLVVEERDGDDVSSSPSTARRGLPADGLRPTATRSRSRRPSATGSSWPFLGWMLAWPYARVLRQLGRPHRHPWWAPPEPIDPRAAAMLGSLCALAAVAAYPGVVMGQTIEFAREELGFSASAQSYALAVLRADFLVALGVVYLADRRGRRKVTLAAIAIGCALNAVSAALADAGVPRRHPDRRARASSPAPPSSSASSPPRRCPPVAAPTR